MCHLPAPAGRRVRVCMGVTSEGIGGTVPLGDESGGVMVALGYGWGAATRAWCLPSHKRYNSIKKLASYFRNLVTFDGAELDLPD